MKMEYRIRNTAKENQGQCKKKKKRQCKKIRDSVKK